MHAKIREGELVCNSKERHNYGSRERYKGVRVIIPINNYAS
jgi:hypothetical protein